MGEQAHGHDAGRGPQDQLRTWFTRVETKLEPELAALAGATRAAVEEFVREAPGLYRAVRDAAEREFRARTQEPPPGDGQGEPPTAQPEDGEAPPP